MTGTNLIAPFGGPNHPTMTSREIAELTGKRHDHVMRDIRMMLVELHGEGGLPSFGDTLPNEQNGQNYPIFRLPKRETLILVSGYSVELRAKIVDRWQELEDVGRSEAIALPRDYAAALRALADESEARQALASRIEADAPKVAFAESVEVAPDAISIGHAAKVLGTGRNRLMDHLRRMGWCTRLGEPYQDKINAGLLDVKIGNWEHPQKGLQRSVTALVTGKGLRKLHTALGGGMA